MGPIFHIQLLHPDTRHSCKKILAESHQKKSYWRKDYFSVHQSNVQAYFKQNSSSGALKRALASPTADWATTHDPQNDYRDVSLNCLQVRRSRFGRPVCRFVRSRVILIHSTLNKKKANKKSHYRIEWRGGEETTLLSPLKNWLSCLKHCTAKIEFDLHTVG